MGKYHYEIAGQRRVAAKPRSKSPEFGTRDAVVERSTTMSKILLGLSAILIAATGVLGFMTKAKVSDIVQLKKKAEEQAADAGFVVKRAQAEAQAAQKVADEAKAGADKAAAELGESKTKLEAAQSESKLLGDQIANLKKEIEKLQAAATAAATPAAPTADPAELVAAKTKLTEAEAKSAEAEQLVQTLTAKLKDAQGETDKLREEKARRDRQIMAKGLEGQILAVNGAWNFVVLSIGNRQGAVPNAEMVVTRGSQMIGKIRITSVEPATSIADILPGAAARGVRIQPGDKVIFPGG